jgi:HAMP domain-containing protein
MTTVLYLILAAATVFGIATALCLWSLLNAPSASSARIRSADAALQQAIERQAELALPSSPFFSRL